MLLQGTHGPLNDDQIRSLRAVVRSAERLESEIRQLAEDYDVVHGPPASSEQT